MKLRQFVLKPVKKLLGPAYSQVVKHIHYVIKRFRGGRFSLNSIDEKLEKYVDYDGGFFVELGANDGLTQSNSLYFELKRGWKGVLVEPSPHNYLMCRQYRGDRSYVYCNACVGFDYKEKFVEISYANLMSISSGLDLDLDDRSAHLASGKKFLPVHENEFEFGASAITLNELLVRSNAPSMIDFLSLDVEGAELDVLKGIDFNSYNFKYMLIEIRDLDRIQSFLKGYDYLLEDQFSSHDYLFKYVGE